MRFLLFTLLLALSISIKADFTSDLQKRLDAIAVNAMYVTHSPFQEMRKFESQRLFDSLTEILAIKESYFLNYDSFKNVSIQKSADQELKIFTWNYISDSGYFKIYGILVLNPNKHDDFFFPLTAFTEKIDTFYQNLSPDNWYPALYYDIYTYKYKRKCYYLLTGFNGGTPWLSERILELITISKKNGPQFGLPVFDEVDDKAKPRTRQIFKYASEGNMVCRIEKEDKIVVFSNLVPVRKTKTGDYEYYLPDGSYDSYKYKRGRWKRVNMPLDFEGNQSRREVTN